VLYAAINRPECETSICSPSVTNAGDRRAQSLDGSVGERDGDQQSDDRRSPARQAQCAAVGFAERFATLLGALADWADDDHGDDRPEEAHGVGRKGPRCPRGDEQRRRQQRAGDLPGGELQTY